MDRSENPNNTLITNLNKIITKLEKKIIDLEALNYQLTSLIENLPGDIYWKDKSGVWLGLNKRCAQSLQRMGFINACNKADVIGKTDYDLFEKKTADGYRKSDIEVMDKKIELSIEENTELPSGEKIILLSTKMPLLNKEGGPMGIIGNTIDISFLKKIESDLKTAKDAAEEANKAKTEFIANMSHDIRTPLTGVLGMSEILETQGQSPELKQYAHDIHECGEHLLSMLNSILDLASAEHINENDLQKETFNLSSCIQDIVQIEKPTITLKNLDFLVKFDNDIPQCIINDQHKIHRILLNLLSNAIKFTTKGSITIEVKLINTTNDSIAIHFSVTDTGMGIPLNQQKKVFERFFRASPSYKGLYTGYGVGLHIAQSYAKLLGSEIKLISQEGIGTSFYFELSCQIGLADDVALSGSPLNSQELNAPECSKSRQPKRPLTDLPIASPFKSDSKNNQHLLLIEDNPIALKALESLVFNAGFRSISAIDGETGLTFAKTQSFDLIISDVGLPGISGSEFTQQLRAWEIMQHKKPVPIIGLTAHAEGEIHVECIQSGMNDVFTKPMSFTTLKSILSKFTSYNPEQNTSSEQNRAKISSGKLGPDLPNTEKELFELDAFPLLDIEQALQCMGNNREVLNDVLNSLITQEIPTEKAAIETAHTQKDWVEIERLSHRVKGGAACTGLVRMKYACQYLERYLKAGHSQLDEKLYNQLISVFDKTYDVIKRWIQMDKR
ncbi:MAG: ATP-binding protein [Legionellaceae bacterium]|nr:ATP-binding protein [Legionellaceae bacterium]